MKTIKIQDGTWKRLMKLKIEHEKRSIDDTIVMLLERVCGGKKGKGGEKNEI